MKRNIYTIESNKTKYSVVLIMFVTVSLSCSYRQKKAEPEGTFPVESISVRMIHLSNPQTVSGEDLSGVDLSGFFPMEVAPLLQATDNLSRFYWVSENRLLEISDVMSVRVDRNPEKNLIMSEDEYASIEQQAREVFPDSMTMSSYDSHVDRNQQPTFSLSLLLTADGKTKLEQVAKNNVGRRFAIIMNGELIATRSIVEDNGNEDIIVRFNCSMDDLLELVK